MLAPSYSDVIVTNAPVDSLYVAGALMWSSHLAKSFTKATDEMPVQLPSRMLIGLSNAVVCCMKRGGSHIMQHRLLCLMTVLHAYLPSLSPRVLR
ncbi:unnamed protein product [Peniophora sp. CBMAI 1063]|nr:unnamed protein product [Peniophora sp. CBMAI 1063]